MISYWIARRLVQGDRRFGKRSAWRTDVKTRYAGLVPLVALLSACSARPEAAIESIYTSLNPASCKQTIDKDRPDEVPYLSCSGVAGHLWNVRRVESGRLSVVVVNAAQIHSH